MKSLVSFAGFAALIFLLTFSTGCAKRQDLRPVAKIDLPVAKEVTAENYLSGDQFCQTYKKITSKEFGKYVNVPYDYDLPVAGSLKIYVYSAKPFDASKPSYIFVDGGPGQNTHGLMPEYLNGDFNELRFDQRGVGCSAPISFELYTQANLYSTKNTVLDLEEIRKSYGIEKWSLYGVSYGTVPATMYASMFPKATTSIILEGVVGNAKDLHLLEYKAQKMNLAMADLNTAQRKSFMALIEEKSDDTSTLMDLFYKLFYSDIGMQKMKVYLQKIISVDGRLDREYISVLRAKLQNTTEENQRPQRPGAVDYRMCFTIYCKNLNFRHKNATGLFYNEKNGFQTGFDPAQDNSKLCDKMGVSEASEAPYKIEANPVTNPIYYFQGSHDGATLAIGALDHWKTVAKGQSYFMLAEKGGHNPNLTRLEQKDSEPLKVNETLLFKKGLMGEDIQQADIDRVNANIDPAQKWILYRDPLDKKNKIEEKLKGIQVVKD